MSEELVAVARFSRSVDAALARSRLESEGIVVHAVDSSADGTLPGLGDFTVGTELRVAEDDYERAGAVLAELLGETEEDEPVDVLPADSWTCGRCGREVGKHLVACPSCGAPTEAVRSSFPITPAPAGWRDEEAAEEKDENPPEQVSDDAFQKEITLSSPSAGVVRTEQGDIDANVTELATALGDQLALRAYRCAVVGFFICLLPVFHLISFGLILWLIWLQPDVSPAGMRKVYIAAAIDGLVFVLWAIAIGWVLNRSF